MKLVRPVVVGLMVEDITNATFTPAAIQLYGDNAGAAWVKKDANGALRQILSDQYLTDITVINADSFKISTYYRTDLAPLNGSTGLYPVPAADKLFRAVVISRPVSGALDTVDITLSDHSSSLAFPKVRGVRWVKSGTGPDADWTMTRHSAAPAANNVIASNELIKTTEAGGSIIVRTRTIREAGSAGSLITKSITREKYRDLGNGTLRIFERTEAPGTPEAVTTTFTYTDITGSSVIGINDPITPPAANSTVNLLTGARLATLRRSDGYWEDYEYEYNGGTRIMLTRQWSAWKNSAPGDRANSRETVITLEEGSRTVIEKIAGQIVSNVHETLTIAADGSRTLRETRQTGSGAALITEHGYHSDSAAEPNKGRIRYTRHADGTLTRYTYAPVGTALKTTIENGAVDAAQFAPSATGPVPAILQGTRREIVTNGFDIITEEKVFDIASGLILSQSITTDSDLLGRPLKIVHDGDPDDFETYTYACCGVDTHRARDGSLTQYVRDALERPTTTTVTLGSRETTTTYVYDTENIGADVFPRTRVTRTVTAGANSATVLVSESVSNLRGQTLLSRSADSNGDGNPEVMTYTHDETNRIRTSTGPDGITQVSTSYADGQMLSSIRRAGNTPVSPETRYDYSLHSLQGGGIKTTVSQIDTIATPEVTLSTGSSFTDLAGRSFRSEAPGYSGATLVSETQFDERGRVIGRSSTGQPASRMVLDLEGEVIESWTDSNGDGEFNNSAVNGIRDSLSRSERDYVTEGGRTCARSRQWVRTDANTDILLALQLSATNGTWSRNTPLNGAMTETVSSKPLNGSATSTTSTYLSPTEILQSVSTVTLNAAGTVSRSVVNKATTGATITSASSISDLLDRNLSQTGERGLTTSYSDFTASGSPLRATFSDGTSSLTTLDAASRPVKVESFDAANNLIATTFTSYHLDGQVKATWGTHTYPTSRTYDLEGRMKTLSTYRSVPAAQLESATLDLSTHSADLTTW
ncbi:MAG: hypothetical protein MUF31_17175, partial [Akkermansiaceae bacterium]|nr:hypothetical protein [Akkermansiaceae bacterium]